MVLTWIVSVSAAIFATIGAGSLFVGLFSKGALRTPSLRLSCYAFGAAGGLLMFGGLFGRLGSDALVAGILMMTFATGVTFAGKNTAPQNDERDAD
jgi:hypothetical protein